MKIEELFSVRGKVALVTGGSRGIGEMIARAYVENGARVYITARKAEACDALANELSRSGECISIPGDISRSVAESGWDKVMDLNVKSAFFMTQRVFKLLQAAGSKDDYARVINIGSIEGMRTSHLEAYSYAGSKAAILHLTRMMAKYLAKDHIAVNAIAPGYFPSKMTDAIAEEESQVIEGNTRCDAGDVRKIWRAWPCIWPRVPAVSFVDRLWWSRADWRRQDELKLSVPASGAFPDDQSDRSRMQSNAGVGRGRPTPAQRW